MGCLQCMPHRSGLCMWKAAEGRLGTALELEGGIPDPQKYTTVRLMSATGLEGSQLMSAADAYVIACIIGSSGKRKCQKRSWPCVSRSDQPVWNLVRVFGCRFEEGDSLRVTLCDRDALRDYVAVPQFVDHQQSTASTVIVGSPRRRRRTVFGQPQKASPKLQLRVLTAGELNGMRLTKYVFLIRHGQSRWNMAQARTDVGGMLGHFDHSLSLQGRKQAEELFDLVQAMGNGSVLGDEYTNEFRKLGKIVSSPLMRALQTALIALRRCEAFQKHGITLLSLAREHKKLFGRDTQGGARGDQIPRRVRRHLRRLYGDPMLDAADIFEDMDVNHDGVLSRREVLDFVSRNENLGERMGLASPKDWDAFRDEWTGGMRGSDISREQFIKHWSKIVGKEGAGRHGNLEEDRLVLEELAPLTDRLDVNDTMGIWWEKTQESMAQLDRRVHEVLCWLKYEQASSVALVGHSLFFMRMLLKCVHPSLSEKEPSLCAELGRRKLENCAVLGLRVDFSQHVQRCIVGVKFVSAGLEGTDEGRASKHVVQRALPIRKPHASCPRAANIQDASTQTQTQQNGPAANFSSDARPSMAPSVRASIEYRKQLSSERMLSLAEPLLEQRSGPVGSSVCVTPAVVALAPELGQPVTFFT